MRLCHNHQALLNFTSLGNKESFQNVCIKVACSLVPFVEVKIYGLRSGHLD